MAALGMRTLAMLFGASYGGTYLYNNMDHARSVAARILLQHQTEENKNTSAGAESAASNSTSNVDALSAQMDALAREMSRTRDHPVVLVGPSGPLKGSLATISDILNLLGWAVVAVSVGGVGYYVAVKRNVSLRDLAWVSQRTFAGTVGAMQKGISTVSGAVRAVRRELDEKLRMMQGHVDEMHDSLSGKIEDEIGGVKVDVNGVHKEVVCVKDRMDDFRIRFEQLDGKMDMATSGIMALVKVVSTLAPERLQPGTPFFELKRFMNSNPHEKIAGSSVVRRLSNRGLGLLSGGEVEEASESDEPFEAMKKANSKSSKGSKSKRKSSFDSKFNDEKPLPWQI